MVKPMPVPEDWVDELPGEQPFHKTARDAELFVLGTRPLYTGDLVVHGVVIAHYYEGVRTFAARIALVPKAPRFTLPCFCGHRPAIGPGYWGAEAFCSNCTGDGHTADGKTPDEALDAWNEWFDGETGCVEHEVLTLDGCPKCRCPEHGAFDCCGVRP